MATLISPLVLLINTSLTNLTTLPTINQMMSYAVLHGGFQRSHSPLRVLEDAIMNVIFSVLQSGCMNQHDTEWLIEAWTAILPSIPTALSCVTFAGPDEEDTTPTTSQGAPGNNSGTELPATGTSEPPTLPTPPTQSNSSNHHKHSNSSGSHKCSGGGSSFRMPKRKHSDRHGNQSRKQHFRHISVTKEDMVVFTLSSEEVSAWPELDTVDTSLDSFMPFQKTSSPALLINKHPNNRSEPLTWCLGFPK